MNFVYGLKRDAQIEILQNFRPRELCHAFTQWMLRIKDTDVYTGLLTMNVISHNPFGLPI